MADTTINEYTVKNNRSLSLFFGKTNQYKQTVSKNQTIYALLVLLYIDRARIARSVYIFDTYR